MIKRTFTLLLIIFFFSSCKNNTQISEHFITEYNNKADENRNSIIRKTYAKIDKDKIPKEYIIDIIVELTIRKAEYKKYLGFSILPKSAISLLTDPDVEELIKTGGKITLKYRTYDNFFIEEAVLDINMLNELKQRQNLIHKKALTLKQLEISRSLEKINQSLPYTNEDGTKLLKLEIDEWNNINCYVQYDGDYEDFSKYAFKERMYHNKFISNIINKKNKYNIISITYKFQTANGQNMVDYMTKP